ncbi:MAG: DUF2283 domain-containing protein [Candidatus Nanohaloarchaea archaeon]
MKISFDDEADAIYIQLSDGEIAENRKLDDRTVLDLDGNGNIIGVEILDASKRFKEAGELSIDFSDLDVATV